MSAPFVMPRFEVRAPTLNGRHAEVPAVSPLDPDGKHYRYSVKCDRAANAQLEKAARRAGLTVTAMVQAHFETLVAAPQAEGLPPARRLVAAFGITRRQADLLVTLAQAADAFGLAALSRAELARRMTIAPCDLPRVIAAVEPRFVRCELSDDDGATGRARRYRVAHAVLGLVFGEGRS